jgi:hypothetical protein
MSLLNDMSDNLYFLNNEMNSIQSDISVLIPDSQDHKFLVLQFINCLALHKNIKIYVMSSDRHNFVKYSRRIKHLSYYPEGSDES